MTNTKLWELSMFTQSLNCLESRYLLFFSLRFICKCVLSLCCSFDVEATRTIYSRADVLHQMSRRISGRPVGRDLRTQLLVHVKTQSTIKSRHPVHLFIVGL